MPHITRNTFEVHCHSEAFGRHLHTHISEVIQQKLYPAMEHVLEAHDDAHSSMDFGTIALSVEISKDNWVQELVAGTVRQLALWFEGGETAQETRRTPVHPIQKSQLPSVQEARREDKLEELFIVYLQTGYLPPNGLVPGLETLESALVCTAIFVKRLLQVFQTHRNAIWRFLLNTREEIQETFFEYLEAQNTTLTVRQMTAFLWSSKKYAQAQTLRLSRFLMIFLQLKDFPLAAFTEEVATYGSLERETFKEMIATLAATPIGSHFVSHLATFEESTIQEQYAPEEKDDNGEAFFIPFAGLILLHPFLSPLFESLGYLDNGAFISKKEQHRAVLLVTYLASGNVQLFENEVSLGKVLCGVPLVETVHTDWLITEQEQIACEDLLKAVITHWSALGKTSVEGLQTSFLQREGKLERLKDGSYMLTVEEKAYDILLEQLPWGLGIIKTPFMKVLLECHWN